ncbi:MAG: divalent cation tolerance protein CutA [Clostridiales bacterium]|nr:divalent cation tolerance protein CutA [Clostridiales bacterium]
MPIFENFISYRRKETLLEVKNIYDALKNRGFSTFCDVYTLDNGNFDDNLVKFVKNCTNYILVINNNSLDRCSEEGDWLLREIKLALSNNKNIVIVFVGNVDFNNLPDEINELRYKNGLKFDTIYFDSFVDELVKRFLVKSEDWEKSSENDFLIEGTKLIKYQGNARQVIIPLEIETIGCSAFKDNTSIKEIIFNNKLKIIEESAFERCLSLSHIELPKDVKILETRAFARCYSLLNVTLNDNLTTIEDECFAFCSNLKHFTLSQGVTICKESAFNHCSLLTQFVVEDGNKSFSTIEGILYNYDQSALLRCPTNYTKNCIIIPSTINTIGNYSFYKCSEIKDVILPESTTKIGEYAFADCRNISYLCLPSEINEISETSFLGWESSQIINFEKIKNDDVKSIIEKFTNHTSTTDNLGVNSEYILVKTTFESEHEAIDMAKGLLGKHLITSGQISKLRSIYTWENKFCDENEYELSCITRGEMYSDIEKFIHSHHSYDLCELMVIPIAHVPQNFGDWVTDYIKEKK